MFGALSDQFTAYETRGLNSGLNDSIFTTTTSTTANEIELPSYGKEQSVIEMIRPEVIGIIVASAIMIIFFLGLIGAFLESVLCLRIFGAILSYLFLLTFGGCFYIIILLVISNVQLKLILSTVSCAAVAITIHALLAIAPFAFADLIYQVSGQFTPEVTNPTPPTLGATGRERGEEHIHQVPLGTVPATSETRQESLFPGPIRSCLE